MKCPLRYDSIRRMAVVNHRDLPIPWISIVLIQHALPPAMGANVRCSSPELTQFTTQNAHFDIAINHQ